MKQEIRIKSEIAVEIDAKYSELELREIVKRNLMRAFPNNTRTLIDFSFTEEAETYGLEDIKENHKNKQGVPPTIGGYDPELDEG